MRRLIKEMEMVYDFDEVIDRRGTDSVKWDGMKNVWGRDDLTALWVADMDFRTPPFVMDALRRRLEHEVLGYTMPCEGWDTAICSWLRKRHEWDVRSEWLTFVPGIVRAQAFTLLCFTRPGDRVLVMTPVYHPFFLVTERLKREVVRSPLDLRDGHYHIDFDRLRRDVQGCRALILCNPHNPGGRVWTAGELRRVADICQESGTLVISDEIHCDLTRKGMQHTPLGKVMPDYGRLVTCMAPSKTFNMAGLMFSNVIIRDSGLMATWKARHYDFENPISIAAAQAAYQHGEDWLNELHDYLDKNFAFTGEFLKENLPDAKYQVSEATYLAWVDLSAYFTPDEDLPMFFANEAGVLLEGGDMFVQNSDCFIRLNLACPKSVLEEGLKRIAKATLNK